MSHRLKDEFLLQRRKSFIGREKEIGHVRRWIRAWSAPSEVIFVSGMGGIGKSALLMQFLTAADGRTSCVCGSMGGLAQVPSPGFSMS